jgi:hypothetical protein
VVRPTRSGVTAVVLIATLAFALQTGGTPAPAGAAGVHSAPDACTLLSATDASQLLRLPLSGQAFTALGFPVSPTTAVNPSYSQCRFSSTSAQSQITLIVNAVLAKAPPQRVEAIAAKAQPGGRVLKIDGAPAVWLPWTQQNLRGQGGVLSSTKDGDYIAVDLIYVHRDPLGAAEAALRIVLPRISS